MNHYRQGRLVEVTTAKNPFRDPSGAPYDPSVVLLHWRVNLSPWPTVWSYPSGSEITRASAGVYQAMIDTTTIPGGSQVDYEWVGDPDGTTSPVGQAISDPVSFIVDPAF